MAHSAVRWTRAAAAAQPFTQLYGAVATRVRKAQGRPRSPLAEQSWREQAEQGRLNRGRRRAPPSASAQRVSWTYLTIKPLMVMCPVARSQASCASGHALREAVRFFVLQSMHVDTSTAFTR